MDQDECPSCHRFYSFNEEHRCPAKVQNTVSLISTEETEEINFHESTSDIPNDCFMACSQATSKKNRDLFSFQQSSPNIINIEKESFASSVKELPLISPSHALANSNCPDGTKLQEENEGSDIQRIIPEPSQYIEVGPDHSVSCDANTVDVAYPREPTSNSALSCSYCGRLYPTKKKLLSHVGVHTGEKKFECSECGLGFAQKYHLDRHTEKNVGHDPSICEGCGISFTFPCGLQSHFCLKYRCNLCTMTFSTNGGLIIHKNMFH